MSGLYRALLIDIGNSQVKYALVNQLSDTDKVHAVANVSLLDVCIRQAEQILVACVGKPDSVEKLRVMAAEHQVPIRFITTQAQSFGVQCAYKDHTTLGVDRWLAILAAQKITQLPCAILDLGTANTCDVLYQNQHLGGWIAPGFSLMRESLLQNTQQVFADNQFPEAISLGNTTPNCVNLGCLASQIGFVTMADAHLSAQYKDYLLLICGGSQQLISFKHAKYFKNLVIKGLFRFISK